MDIKIEIEVFDVVIMMAPFGFKDSRRLQYFHVLKKKS